MEFFKIKTFSFPKEIFVRFVLAATMAFAFVACGDDGGSSVPVGYGVGVMGACAGCQEINQYPMQVATFSAANVQGTVQLQNMQVFGNGMRYMSSGATPANNPGNMYSGPVAIRGVFVANGPLVDQSGRCQLPPGSYQITSNSVGSMSMGVLELPDLILTPGNIRIQIVQGIMHQQATRLMGIIKIVQVNGMPCDPRFSDSLF